MFKVSCEDIEKKLRDIGVSKGDSVMVHSFIGLMFGLVKNPSQLLYSAIRNVIGEEGTICVPSFTFKSCSGQEFDPQKTKSEMGVFSEYVRNLPGSKRSNHPIHSIVLNGRLAGDVSVALQSTAFSDDSSFKKLLDRNFTLLFVGVTSTYTTFFHYIEEKIQVPYRYYKNFNITVIDDGEKKQKSFSYFVKPIDGRVSMYFQKREDALLKEGILVYSQVGGGRVGRCSIKSFYDFMYNELLQDPWWMVDREKFQSFGEVVES